jgi:hypothetical protein
MEGATVNKIFNIGLPKSGTTSLQAALVQLGYRSIHNPSRLRRLSYEHGIYRYPGDDWDALTNFGAHFYPQLDSSYPNSRFILTIRDKEAWLRSAEKWFSRKPRNPWIDYRARLEAFGCITFQRERFGYVFDLHYRNVCEYFAKRQNDLLILDASQESAWARLCGFLGHPIPEGPFPHVRPQESAGRIYRAKALLRYCLTRRS